MRYRHRKVVAVPQAFAAGVCESLGECDVPGISWGWFRLEADERLVIVTLFCASACQEGRGMTERDASGREILLNSLNRRDEHKSRYTHNGIAAPMGSRDERKLGRASHQVKSGGGGGGGV